MCKRRKKINYQDPRWQRRRSEVLRRDNFTCQCCGADSRPLHVHHKYYQYPNEIWKDPMEALVTLCVDCHQDKTDEHRNQSKALFAAIYQTGLTPKDLKNIGKFFERFGRSSMSNKRYRGEFFRFLAMDSLVFKIAEELFHVGNFVDLSEDLTGKYSKRVTPELGRQLKRCRDGLEQALNQLKAVAKRKAS